MAKLYTLTKYIYYQKADPCGKRTSQTVQHVSNIQEKNKHQENGRQNNTQQLNHVDGQNDISTPASENKFKTRKYNN